MCFLHASSGIESHGKGFEMWAFFGIKNAPEMTVRAAKLAVRVAWFGVWALNS
jgi:hypothetical protein